MLQQIIGHIPMLPTQNTQAGSNGYADGTFKGENAITRAEVVTVVNRATGRKADESYITKNVSILNKFTDIRNNSMWYYTDVMEAANTHLANSSNDTETWVK